MTEETSSTAENKGTDAGSLRFSASVEKLAYAMRKKPADAEELYEAAQAAISVTGADLQEARATLNRLYGQNHWLYLANRNTTDTVVQSVALASAIWLLLSQFMGANLQSVINPTISAFVVLLGVLALPLLAGTLWASYRGMDHVPHIRSLLWPSKAWLLDAKSWNPTNGATAQERWFLARLQEAKREILMADERLLRFMREQK